MDLLGILSALVGLGFRELQRNMPDSLGLGGNEALAWAIMVLWVSLMPIHSLHRRMGPRLEMLSEILTRDLVYWLGVLLFIVLAFVASTKYLFGGEDEESSGFNSPFDDHFRTWLLSFEAIVELILQGPHLDVARQPGNRHPTIAWVIMALLAVLTTITMVNLLIAMLTETFLVIYKKMEVSYLFEKASLVLSWTEAPSIAAPLNIFELLSSALTEAFTRCTGIASMGYRRHQRKRAARFSGDNEAGDGEAGEEEPEDPCFPCFSFEYSTRQLLASINSGGIISEDWEAPRRLLIETIFKASPFVGLSFELMDAIGNLHTTTGHLDLPVSLQRVLDREHRQSVRLILDRLVVKLRSKGASTFEMLEEMDTNGDGVISLAELEKGLAGLGIDVSKDELYAVMRFFDFDQNGTLDALELEETIRSHCVSEEVERELDSDPRAVLLRALASAAREPEDRTSRDLRNILHVVQGVPFFTAFTASQCFQICRVLKHVALPAGANIFVEGEDGDNFYILIEGEVDVVIRDSVVKTLTAVSSFGELALQEAGGKRTATIRCSVGCVLLSVNRLAFHTAISPEQAQKELMLSLETAPAQRSEADWQRVVEVLGGVDALKFYPASKLRKIAEACHEQRLMAGVAVFREGDAAEHFYVLMQGELEVCVRETGNSGAESQRCVKVLAPRSSFGDAALLEASSSRSATVRCKTDAILLAVHRRDFMVVVSEWKQHEVKQQQLNAEKRAAAALRAFKIGTPLWRPGVGLGIVDAVLRGRKLAFVISYRSGQTIEYDVEAMLSQMKRLPLDSIRHDDVETYRRARLAMLLVLMQRASNGATPAATPSTHVRAAPTREPEPPKATGAAEPEPPQPLELRLRAIEAALEKTLAVASRSAEHVAALHEAFHAIAAVQTKSPDPPPPLHDATRPAPPRAHSTQRVHDNGHRFPRLGPTLSTLNSSSGRQPPSAAATRDPTDAASSRALLPPLHGTAHGTAGAPGSFLEAQVWASEPMGPSVVV